MTEIKQPKIRFKGHIDSWEQRKLGELVTLSSSKRIHLRDYVTSGIPFYRGSEITTGGITSNQELFISEEKYQEIIRNYDVPLEGDLLVTAVGTLGNFWKVDNRRFYYKDGNLIRISNMKVDSNYLLSYFNDGNGKKCLLDSAAGSNQKALTMVKMRDILITFPSEEEQQKIGNFFKQLDDTITLHQQKLEVNKQFKQTMLKKMFPKNGETTPEIRFKGFTDDWKEEKLGNLIKLNKSQEVKRENLTNIRSGYYVLGMRTFSKDGYLDKSKDFWYNLPVEDNPDLFLNIGEFAMIDADMDSELSKIGKVLMNASDEKYLLNSQIRKIKSTQSEHNKFIYPLMSGKKIQKKFKLESSGSIAKHLLDKDVYKQKVLITEDKKEQELIGDFFYQLEKEIYLIEQKLETYKSFKKAMLQKMFI